MSLFGWMAAIGLGGMTLFVLGLWGYVWVEAIRDRDLVTFVIVAICTMGVVGAVGVTFGL